MTPLLSANVPTTRAEQRRSFRHSLLAADREQRWQSGMLCGGREIGSGPTIALPGPRYVQLRLFEAAS